MHEKQESNIVIAQDFRKGIAKRLRDLRVSKKFKQKLVSQKTGINQARLSEFENNKGDLSFDNIERVAQFLGVSMNITFDCIDPTISRITS